MTSDIDVGGVKPLVSRTEIHCGRPGNTRISAGKPSYKSQEEQYQEIQELRRHLGDLREEHVGLKTRNRRLEEDLVRRDRQIEQLMDPSKNDEARRKLTDKGASLVSSLKLRVSRLEATLKDKEAELAKLQASAKATALNEMKIEAETYYQEVVRLRNQLNIAQHQEQQHNNQYQKQPQPYSPQHPLQYALPSPQPQQLQPSSPQDSKRANVGHWSNLRSGRDSREGVRSRRDGDGQESPSTSLRQALVQLEEENSRLGNQVSLLTAENNKLASDVERILGVSDDAKSNYEGMSRAELIREIQRGHEEVNRLAAQHTLLSEALTRRNDIVGENSVLLQAQVSELQGREAEWERERSSLRDLINTLKEDRIFYKESAQKKDSELDSLRAEVQSLQHEVISLYDSQHRKNEQVTPPIPQRSARGSVRSNISGASRSGSSSEASTPARRPRPSSARPPPSNSRLQRSQKSSSEPREIPQVNRTNRALTPQRPKKLPPTRSSSKPPSTSSSPSKPSISQMMNSGNNARPGSGSARQGTSSSSTPKASPYGSPKQGSVNRASSSSSTPKIPTPVSSPRKVPGSVSPQRKASGYVSPQCKTPGSVSSGGRIPMSRSSSRTSTPSSSAKSSPHKVSSPSRSSPNRSISKVPLSKSTSSPASSPSKVGKKREESSRISTPSKSLKQESLRDSSAEDERVLAEILFHRETDSSGEASDHQKPFARQQTITLSSQEDAASTHEETEHSDGQASASSSLLRQNTVTLVSKTAETEATTQEEEAQASVSADSESQVEAAEEKIENEVPESPEEEKISIHREEEIIENLEVLESLLSSHLSRQWEVNNILSQAPLLVRGGQDDGNDVDSESDRHAREAPDGEESSKGSSNRSQNMVRQGTFNVHGQDTVATVHATLDGHLARVNKGNPLLKDGVIYMANLTFKVYAVLGLSFS